MIKSQVENPCAKFDANTAKEMQNAPIRDLSRPVPKHERIYVLLTMADRSQLSEQSEIQKRMASSWLVAARRKAADGLPDLSDAVPLLDRFLRCMVRLT